MKKYFFYLPMMFLIILSCKTTQSIDDKIGQLMKLKEYESKYVAAIEYFIDNEETTKQNALNPTAMNEVKMDLLKDGTTKLDELEAMVKNDLSTADIDQLITKLPNGVDIDETILERVKNVELKWMNSLNKHFIDKFGSKIRASKFNDSPDLDCSALKEGKFYILYSDGSTIDIDRSANEQIEIHNGKKTTSKIEWLSDCKYKIRMVSSEEEYDADVAVVINITEISEFGYKYIGTEEGKEEFIEGDVYFDKK